MTNKGNFIAELRKEAGYTQKTLAEALHITDKAVSKWERGLSLPDVSLLPKLSLLLDIDMSFLLESTTERPHEGWKGLIDLRDYNVDIGEKIFDKPLVYYILTHFMLADIFEICFLGSDINRQYLQNSDLSSFGFRFSYSFDDTSDENWMIMNRPCFLFGSDLTHHYQGAMVSNSLLKLAPENMSAPILFCPAEYAPMYSKNPDYLMMSASTRTLGRGMLCIDMCDDVSLLEASMFVRLYQKHSSMALGSIEEISFRKGMIDEEGLEGKLAGRPYRDLVISDKEDIK